MKIAVHIDGPIIRGNEEQVIRIAAGLASRGHEVVVSCRANGPVASALQSQGIRTTGVRPRGDADLASAALFAAWLRRESVEALLLTSWTRTFIAGAAAALARVPRVVFRIGGMQPIDSRGARLERFALRHWYHAIIANSDTVADRMVRALPDIAQRIRVVVNGIEDRTSEAAPLREMLGLPPDTLIIAAVGGLEPNKGFDVLVNAMRQVEGAHVVLAGSASPERRAGLDRTLEQYGIADRVHFLGWRSDVPAVLAASDLFALPSRSEGFSVAKLEAMRAGLPVVSTDVGGTRESQAPYDGRPGTGWIVPVGDAAALADALNAAVRALRTDPATIERMRAEGRWRVANRFTVERMLDGYEAVLCGRL